MPTPTPVAVVTGASSGIGHSVAGQLASAGFDVVIHYGTNSEGAERTARRVREAGRRALTWQCPLADMPDGDAFWAPLSGLLTCWGHDRIDALVLNAGIDERMPFDAADAASIRRIFDVNVVAPTLIAQRAEAWLREGSSVVFVSSIAATDPIPDSIPYSSSKAALNTLARGLAERLAPRGIRVNAVAPGAVDTPLQAEANRDRLRAAGLLGDPEAVAEAIVFLATDRGRWVNGQLLRVAGPKL